MSQSTIRAQHPLDALVERVNELLRRPAVVEQMIVPMVVLGVWLSSRATRVAVAVGLAAALVFLVRR